MELTRSLLDHDCPNTCILLRDVEQSLNEFTPAELREVFRRALPAALRRLSDPAARSAAMDRIRSHCGIWYSTLFLAGIYEDEQLDSQPPYARYVVSLAREALAWMEPAFLANVVVYFRDARSEDIHMATALRDSRDGTLDAFETFKDGFLDYIRKSGTIVRTDAHFGQPPRFDSLPISPRKGLRLLEDFRTVTLPSDPDKTGDPAEFQRIVHGAFGQIFPGWRPEEPYYQIFESGGWDTGDPGGQSNVGAVAHIFVLLEGSQVRWDTTVLRQVHAAENERYRSAMRTALSRVATAYSLNVMRGIQSTLEQREAFELRRSRMMTERVRDLDVSIRSVEESVRGVRSLLLENTWEMVQAWIPVLRDLFAGPAQQVWICGAPIMSVHQEERWGVELVSAALLALIQAQDANLTRGMAHRLKWAFYSTVMYENERDLRPIWHALQRRGILRKRFGAGGDPTELADDVIVLAQAMKEASQEKKDTPDFAAVLLEFAVGIMFRESAGHRLLFPPMIDEKVVISGLYRLLTELLVAPDMHDAVATTELTTSGKSWGIRISPMLLDNGPGPLLHETISADGFQQLGDTVQKLVRKQAWPGYASRTTSVAALAALGIHEGNWAEARQQISYDPNSLSLVRAIDGAVIAALDYVDDLYVRYNPEAVPGGAH